MEQFHNTIRNLRNIGKIDTPNKHLNDRSFFWLGTDTLIKKMAGLNWFYWLKTSSLNEMVRYAKIYALQ